MRQMPSVLSALDIGSCPLGKQDYVPPDNYFSRADIPPEHRANHILLLLFVQVCRKSLSFQRKRNADIEAEQAPEIRERAATQSD